jgi:Flp pilus assembly protein TadD
MQPLEAPDCHHLLAAEGWLELGSPSEAGAELSLIAPEHQRHPDVLEFRWTLHAHAREWDAALEAARALVLAAPDRASGWLHRAYALRRAADGGLTKAQEALKPAAEKFPQEPMILFNLACYACQLGQLMEARGWIKRAMKVGGIESVKLMALADEDLKPLWPELSGQ